MLIAELESETCSAGAPLRASLTSGRVSQLFKTNMPDEVQNPPCPGGPENTRQLKRKASKFYPPSRRTESSTSVKGVVAYVLFFFPFIIWRYCLLVKTFLVVLKLL